MADYQVKGSTIASKFDFVRERYGERAEAELREELETEGLRSVLSSSWYPFSVYESLNKAIADKLLGGDLSRLVEVGKYSAQNALTGVYKAYTRQDDFQQFLRRISSLHSTFYSHGDMEVTAEEGSASCEIHLTGAPLYTDADLYVAQGFYMGAAEVFGLAGVDCSLKKDANGAHFTLRWMG